MMLKSSNPHMTLLWSTLILSSLTLLTTSNWLIMWAMFEINLMSFIPVLMNNQKSYELESSIKYFIIQAISSSVMLMAIMLYLSSVYTSPACWALLLSIMMKMGGAPCHLWLVPVMSNIKWGPFFIMATWQKLAPLFMLSNLSISWSLQTLFTIIILNATIGAIGGLNQSQMCSLLAYSSIAHMAWTLSAMLYSSLLMFLYFLTYTLMMALITMSTAKSDLTFVMNLNTSIHPCQKFTSLMSLNLLSLGGLPPLLGFMPKWMVMKSLTPLSTSLPVILIICSLISLFYYLNILISAQTHPKNLNMTEPTNLSITSALSILLGPLLLMMM